MDGVAKENCCEINTVKNEQCLHCTFKNGIYEDIKNWMYLDVKIIIIMLIILFFVYQLSYPLII